MSNDNIPHEGFNIGIDIGGTKVAAGIVSLNPDSNEPLIQHRIEQPTPTEGAAFIKLLSTMVNELKAKAGITAIGISTAGTVDTVEGVIIGSTANLPAAREVPHIKEALEKQTHLPVHAENDANAAAFGEMAAGAAKGMQDVVMVTLGTGVGTGIVANGQMIRGAHYSAGEGGHIVIYDNKRACSCGRPDCWEAYASGNGLNVTIREMVAEASEEQQAAFLKHSGNPSLQLLTTHHWAPALEEHDALAKEISLRWHHDIARGVRSVINLLDPHAVVVGGGLAKFVDFPMLKELVKPMVMTPSFDLLPATLGNDAGMVGAAFLAQHAKMKVTN